MPRTTMELNLEINDSKTGKSYKKDVSNGQFLLHKKIGEKVSGDSLGMNGYELIITGGSDLQGFPMRKDTEGAVRRRPLVVSGVGFRKKSSGVKQRKTVIGNTINDNIKQVNLKVEKYGREQLEKALGIEVKEEIKIE